MTTKEKPLKLKGKWKIYKAAQAGKYAWAAGLPVGALFEITSALRFKPVKGCGGQFANGKPLKKPPTQINLLHDGDHSEGDLDEDETLMLTLDDKKDIFFKFSEKDGKKDVWIMGPVDLLVPGAPAGRLREHGGPHGEPA